MENIFKTNSFSTKLYWILLVLLAVFFTFSGYLEVTKNPATYLKTLKMGYPPYFILTLGIAKIAGAITLLLPNLKRLKEWAFAGFTFDVIFAFISGLAINSYADCFKSALVLGMILLVYKLFRAQNKSPQNSLPGHQ